MEKYSQLSWLLCCFYFLFLSLLFLYERNIVVLELFVVCIQVMRPNHGDEYTVLELNPMEWTFDSCPKVKFVWDSFLNVFPHCFHCSLSFAGLLTLDLLRKCFSL